MKIERFEIQGLSQYSYMVSSNGKAAVIDPERNIDCYLTRARSQSIAISYVLETHIHADFVSGATALAQATGAELCLSGHGDCRATQYQFQHKPVLDGDSIEFCDLALLVIHTPGHTPEHISFLAFDRNRSATIPIALFSGDFLFVGSFGRPDLLGEAATTQLINELFVSAHERISHLPDGIELYPGHGPGSFCGSAISATSGTTLGYERAVNNAFSMDRPTFTHHILDSLPPSPVYYPRNKQLNAQGPAILTGQFGKQPLSPCEVASLSAGGEVTLLDVREAAAFGSVHVSRSINIGSGRDLSLWAGWVLDPEKPIVLVGSGEPEDETVRSLARVGLDSILGYLEGGLTAWIEAGYDVSSMRQCSVEHLRANRMQTTILDVRSAQEWNAGHIDGAVHVMLGDLKPRIHEIDSHSSVHVVCASGYRSSIASSILTNHGVEWVVNTLGGMKAWNQRRFPVVSMRLDDKPSSERLSAVQSSAEPG
jgi:hydroxyacylglutathione hydrolase